MKTEATSMGMNRTGIGTSPVDSATLIRAAEEACASGALDSGVSLASVRVAYESEAEPIGTVPIPTTLKGAVKTAIELVKGRGATAFIDKLGERLAFERTGTRLYEALLTKLDASSSWEGGPSWSELVRFRDEEAAHFTLLRRCMEELGADPTAQTPSADVIGVASMGLLQVVTDPRTTVAQSLNALLTAELTDNDGWEMLVDVAEALKQDEMAERFLRAQEQEDIHLSSVREWLRARAMLDTMAEHGKKAA
ncbi:Hypothetical protein A7982_05810 [Minicystis rosea]|nr:Hypothetical protein A7982_05810 [Minicystis rosea]